MADIAWHIRHALHATPLIHATKTISMSPAPTCVVALQPGNLENHEDFLPAKAVMVNMKVIVKCFEEGGGSRLLPNWYPLDRRLGA
jgi:hypothetical protein